MSLSPDNQSALTSTISSIQATIEASSFIRKMRGGSQAVLVEGNDGGLYVVKMMGNSQGSAILANELIGGILCTTLGFSVPEGRPVYLTDRFLNDNPAAWFECPDGKRRPVAGLHYGACFVGTTEGPGRPFELITGRQRLLVQNRHEFLGMYLFDVWSNNLDRRQALYLNHLDAGTIYAIFIDQGFLFGRSSWILADDTQQMYFRKKDAQALVFQQNLISSWLELFKRAIPAALSKAVGVVPPEWCSGNLVQLQDILLQRLGALEEIVEPFVFPSA